MKFAVNDIKYQKEYEKELVKLENKFAKIFDKKEPVSLYEPSAYITTSAGKRLRPFLVLLAAKAVGGSFGKAYNAALSVELLHNFTLVHDDIMDNADLRRGKETLHKKYDLSTAILTGDSLLGVAYTYLLKDCTENCKGIVQTFTQGVIEVCEGQSLDELFETKNNVTIEDYKIMISKKTAALLEMCCSIGAQIGSGSKKEISALKKYGHNLGMAFQLADDLLDITADEAKFGKVIGGDLVEGKKTFLFLTALQKAKGKNKKALLEVVKNKGIRKNQVNKYRKLYEELGVLEDTKKEIFRYNSLALKALKNVDSTNSVENLTWLANTLTGRTK